MSKVRFTERYQLITPEHYFDLWGEKEIQKKGAIEIYIEIEIAIAIK